jgi:hypothetical protein
MKRHRRNRLLVTLASILAWALPVAAKKSPYTPKDIPPPASRAARVQITQGPELESFRNNEAIIRWTSNNPGGSDEHFGVVKYGTEPNHLDRTAKSHIRLNRNHDYTVFRVRVEGLKVGTTYYYTVGSMNADGTEDPVTGGIYHFTAPSGA